MFRQEPQPPNISDQALTMNTNTDTTASTNANAQPALVSGQGKASPKGNPPAAAARPPVPELLKRLDSELLAITTTKLTEVQARERFRKLLITVVQGVGACHVRRDEDGDWDVKPAHSDGRVPRRHDFVTTLNQICDLALDSGKTQIRKLQIPETMGLFAPVNITGISSEVLLLVAPESHDVALLLNVLQRVCASLRLLLSGQQAKATDWKLRSLAMIMELCGSMEHCDSVNDASEELSNELARAMGCSMVAVGLQRKRNMDLVSVSGLTKVEKSSETGRALLETLIESRTRACAGVFPPKSEENSHLLIAHKRLARVCNSDAIFSQPLETESGESVGAIVLAGSKTVVLDKKVSRFMSAAAPRFSSSLAVLGRAEKHWFGRTLSKAWKLSTSKFRWIALSACLLAIAIMFIPITYRVRCSGTIEPMEKRFAVAPFAGLIMSANVKPGDRVRTGDVLAGMDGKTIRWELSGIAAEKKKADRQREIELSQGNVPEALLSELENRKLASREQVLNFQRDNLQIKSPIDGFVLSGSLENAEASSVETGQVLFEVGPIDPVKFQIAIPAIEFGEIEKDAVVKLWIEGHEDEPIEGEIDRIYPKSELKDAKNVFIAELEIENGEEKFMPGMKGTVRIDCGKRPIGSIIFRKPLNWLRANIAWW